MSREPLRDFRRERLWRRIDEELNDPTTRRSVVAPKVLVAERWTTAPSSSCVNTTPGGSRALPHGAGASSPSSSPELAFVEYWDAPLCGGPLILVALADRLVLRTTFNGADLSIPYAEVRQLYLDPNGETLEVVCGGVVCAPMPPHLSLSCSAGGGRGSGFITPMKQQPSRSASTPTGGGFRPAHHTPTGLFNESFEEEEDEVFVPDMSTAVSASPPPHRSSFRQRHHCTPWEAHRQYVSSATTAPFSIAGTTYRRQREHLFSFHAPARFGGEIQNASRMSRSGARLPGEVVLGLRSLFEYLSPRVASRPWSTVAPLRRFSTTCVSCGCGAADGGHRSDWLEWVQVSFAFLPLNVEEKHFPLETTGWDRTMGRRSIAEVLGYAADPSYAHSAVLEDVGKSSYAFDWDRDVQQYLSNVFVSGVVHYPASASLPVPQLQERAKPWPTEWSREPSYPQEREMGAHRTPELLEVGYGPTLMC